MHDVSTFLFGHFPFTDLHQNCLEHVSGMCS